MGKNRQKQIQKVIKALYTDKKNKEEKKMKEEEKETRNQTVVPFTSL